MSHLANLLMSISAHGGCAELDAKTRKIEGFPPQPYSLIGLILQDWYYGADETTPEKP